jgi:uncharacterized protein (TIGR00369 family)
MTSRSPSAQELNAVLERTPFLAAYGMSVVSCGEGECRVLLPFRRSLERPGGIVSGMALMGAADVAMWLAIMTLRGVDEQWVTSDMKSTFLRRAANENVVCHAKVLKLGRRTAYGTVDSTGGASGLVAHHVVSYAKASPAAT